MKHPVGLSSLKFFWWAAEFLFILASEAFRPFKLIQGHWYLVPIESALCDFLLVRNSNLGPVLHRFGDQTGFMCYYHPNFGGVPVAPDCPCWASTSAWALSYSAVKLFWKNSNLFDHSNKTSQTYGQTDGRHAIS